MLQIMLTCARTGQFVSTGIETDLETFITMPEVVSQTRCAACGGTHFWTKRETWLGRGEGACRTSLPAAVLTGR
jgi:hypothetical protein